MSRKTSPASIEITASWTRNGFPGCSIRLRMPGELNRQINQEKVVTPAALLRNSRLSNSERHPRRGRRSRVWRRARVERIVVSSLRHFAFSQEWISGRQRILHQPTSHEGVGANRSARKSINARTRDEIVRLGK